MMAKKHTHGRDSTIRYDEHERLKQQLSQAQEQVQSLLKAKTAAEARLADMQHDYNGMVGCLNSGRSILKQLGAPLPPVTGKLKHDAVIVLDAALSAAQGKQYMPSEEQRQYRAEIDQLKKLIASGEPCFAIYRQRPDENEGREFFFAAHWHGDTQPSEGERLVSGVFLPKDGLPKAVADELLLRELAAANLNYALGLRLLKTSSEGMSATRRDTRSAAYQAAYRDYCCGHSLLSTAIARLAELQERLLQEHDRAQVPGNRS